MSFRQDIFHFKHFQGNIYFIFRSVKFWVQTCDYEACEIDISYFRVVQLVQLEFGDLLILQSHASFTCTSWSSSHINNMSEALNWYREYYQCLINILHVHAKYCVQYSGIHTPCPCVFLLSWGNFGDKVLQFCIFCQLPPPNKSPNFKTVE